MVGIWWPEDVEDAARLRRSRLDLSDEVGLALRHHRRIHELNQRDLASDWELSSSRIGRLEVAAGDLRLGLVLSVLARTSFGLALVAGTRTCDPTAGEPTPRMGRKPRVARAAMDEADVRAAHALRSGEPIDAETMPAEVLVAVASALRAGRLTTGESVRQRASRLATSESTLRRAEKAPGQAQLRLIDRALALDDQRLALVLRTRDGPRLVPPEGWPASELVARTRDDRARFPGHRGARATFICGPNWWWFSSARWDSSIRNPPAWEAGVRRSRCRPGEGVRGWAESVDGAD